MHISIPECRAMLAQIATECEASGDTDHASRIRTIVAGMHRRKRVTHGAPRKRTQHNSPALRTQIIKLHKADPHCHQQDIAVALNTNAGRVAEVLREYYGEQ